jgi:hypothetical protein
MSGVLTVAGNGDGVGRARIAQVVNASTIGAAIHSAMTPLEAWRETRTT